ncbi:MAG: histidinol-phosphatase HisJ family protein [Oscillospiraceae bacterium]|nr:histidinol-phosphatase HisJ family protein [Oscillospiraceae bacterium]
MIKADQHVHSSFSSDSDELLENAVNAAIAASLDALCVTEHMDMDYPTGEFMLDADSYRAELFRLKELYSDRIELLFGVELGLMDYLAPRLYEFASSQPFDFIIGSSHLVDGVDPYYPEYFNAHGDHNGILRYFECILANITTFADFDVYGHLDYVVRYSHAKSYSPAEHAELLDEILKKLISMDKGIELNTAGLKYGLGWAHPHPELLRRYRELGGEIITVGSDGHKGEHIAYDFDKASDILQAAGFEYYTVFRQRKPEFIKI